MDPANAWVALVHHPVYDKNRRVVSTALTNLDLHDIARSVRTYGLAGYFVVHPVEAQRQLADRILAHWRDEPRHEFRADALARIRVVSSLEEAKSEVEQAAGRAPLVVATAARAAPGVVGYHELAHDGPLLLVLGTGWGLTDELMAGCGARLAPLQAASDYNHLSVRSACAIILDRLYGDRPNYATS
jgi:hypothetical protein